MTTVGVGGTGVGGSLVEEVGVTKQKLTRFSTRMAFVLLMVEVFFFLFFCFID